MKALFLVRHFPPTQSSGSLRSQAFAQFSTAFGITPVIVCARPQENCGPTETALMEEWKDDTRWPVPRRIEWRSPQPIIGFDTILRRIPVLATLSVSKSRRRMVDRIVSAARDAIVSEEPKVIYASHAPPETLLAARELSAEYDLPFVADLRDPWSHAPWVKYRHYVDFLSERRLERDVLHAASSVIVPTEGAAKLLQREFHVSGCRISVIPNGYFEADFADNNPADDFPPDRFVILHAGEMASGQKHQESFKTRVKAALGLDYDPLRCTTDTRSPKYLLTAIKNLLDRNPVMRSRIIVCLVGLGDSQRREIENLFPYPDCIRIYPRVSSRRAASFCLRANLLILLQNQYFLRGEEIYVAIPAKLYTYLRAGRSILACVDDPEIGSLVRKFSGGNVVKPKGVGEMENAIDRTFQNWRLNPDSENVQFKPRSVAQFDRVNLTEVFVNVLMRTAGCRKEPKEALSAN